MGKMKFKYWNRKCLTKHKKCIYLPCVHGVLFVVGLLVLLIGDHFNECLLLGFPSRTKMKLEDICLDSAM